MKYHRAGRVYDFNPVGFGLPVRGRRLTVGTQEHFGVMQGRECGVVDGDEAEFFQTVAFLAVVHDVAQTIERGSPCQLFFRLVDGAGHAEAEARPLVYLYFHL